MACNLPRLDPHETSAPTPLHTRRTYWQVNGEPDLPSSTIDRSDEALHQTFRHSGWATRRKLIHTALARRYARTSRLEAFENCGSQAWVCRSNETPPRYRIKTNKCRDRFCDPCGREKRNLVAQNVARNLPSNPLRFLTLTIKSTDHDLSTCITKLLSSWSKLRNRAVIRRCIHGGLYFLEITLNEETQQWHPHLHALLQGSYLPIDVVRKHWWSITKDSFICDIRWIKSPGHAVGYITKYASKSIPSKVARNPDKLNEAMIALAGLRTFNTFGAWKSWDLSRCPADDAEWIVVGTLAVVIDEARNGDAECVHALNMLKKYDLEPIFTETLTRGPPREGQEELRRGFGGVSREEFDVAGGRSPL